MDPIFFVILIFAVFVPVGIILAIVVLPALRRKGERDRAAREEDLRDEPPLDG